MDALGAPKQPPYYQPGRPPRAFNIHPTHTQIRQMHEEKKKGSGNGGVRTHDLYLSRRQGVKGVKGVKRVKGVKGVNPIERGILFL